MPSTKLREFENVESALRRFRKLIEKSGVLSSLRAKEFYEKPTAERKRKKSAAIKRHYKKIRMETMAKREH